MLKTLICILFLSVLIIGCREEFTFSEPPETAFSYNIFSELFPGNVVSLELLQNTPIGQQLTPFNHRDAIIEFSGPDVPGQTLSMAYNTTSEKYHLVREDFRVTEGNTYNLNIIVEGETIDTIEASTTIPKAVEFDVEILSKRRIPKDSVWSDFELVLAITIADPHSRPAYYRFVPFRLESYIKIINGTTTIVTDTPDKSPFEITEVMNNGNAVTRFDHRPGITIEEAKLNSSRILLRLHTQKRLKDGSHVDASDGKEVINRLRLELYTMSQELYNYDLYVNQQLGNQGTNQSFPAREVHNILNASGVFGGQSRVSITPRIN